MGAVSLGVAGAGTSSSSLVALLANVKGGYKSSSRLLHVIAQKLISALGRGCAVTCSRRDHCRAEGQLLWAQFFRQQQDRGRLLRAADLAAELQKSRLADGSCMELPFLSPSLLAHSKLLCGTHLSVTSVVLAGSSMSMGSSRSHQGRTENSALSHLSPHSSVKGCREGSESELVEAISGSKDATDTRVCESSDFPCKGATRVNDRSEGAFKANGGVFCIALFWAWIRMMQVHLWAPVLKCLASRESNAPGSARLATWSASSVPGHHTTACG